MKKAPVPTTIDEYIENLPRDVQVIVQKVRATIHKAAPGAQEKISYQIPTFTLYGNLVSFAAWKKHIGLYPGSSAVRQLKKELAAYAQAKGTVQFPLDEPIPYALIAKVVKFRVKENAERNASKAKSKSKKRRRESS